MGSDVSLSEVFFYVSALFPEREDDAIARHRSYCRFSDAFKVSQSCFKGEPFIKIIIRHTFFLVTG